MTPLSYLGAAVSVTLLGVALVIGAAICVYEAGNRLVTGERP